MIETPQDILMSDAEIHEFGIQVVVRQLQNEGHEILSVESELGKAPQVVAKIQNEVAFIVVRTAPYPDNGQPPSATAKERLLDHAAKHNAKAYFAAVGIANAKGVDSQDERLSSKPIRGAGF